MFDTDALHARGKALEDEYFHRVDEALRDRLRESIRRDEAKALLIETLGFNDDQLVDHLVDVGIEAGTVSAMVLVPLVFVAWSDGTVSAAERQTVMGEALHRGLGTTKKPFELVEHWLEKRPPESLWSVWREYIESLRKSLPSEIERVLSNSLFNRCEAVANASAGPLGTNRVSKPEREMLDRIKKVLEKS